MQAAKCPKLLRQAKENYNKLRYAPGTMACKNAKLRPWQKIARAAGIDPWPLSPQVVETVAGVLRSAGYVSGFLYVIEAKQEHERNSSVYGPVGADTLFAIQDAKRPFKRSAGGGHAVC